MGGTCLAGRKTYVPTKASTTNLPGHWSFVVELGLRKCEASPAARGAVLMIFFIWEAIVCRITVSGIDMFLSPYSLIGMLEAVAFDEFALWRR